MTTSEWTTADHYETLETIESWLKSLHCTTWGQHFDLSQEASTAQAAVWFLGQMESLLDWTCGADASTHQGRLF
jgi:hypothetical protein